MIQLEIFLADETGTKTQPLPWGFQIKGAQWAVAVAGNRTAPGWAEVLLGVLASCGGGCGYFDFFLDISFLD